MFGWFRVGVSLKHLFGVGSGLGHFGWCILGLGVSSKAFSILESNFIFFIFSFPILVGLGVFHCRFGVFSLLGMG